MSRSRRPLMAGNWKMNGTRAEARELLAAVKAAAATTQDRDVLVAPPYTLLGLAARELQGSYVRLAAQNVYWEEKGAFTGEVSPEMLRDVGCTHVIVGHSERRQYFRETDKTVNKRLVAALKEELDVILCVGETLKQREAGETLDVVERQVRGALKGLKGSALNSVVIAYEPVWAIGTGKVATPEQAQEIHAAIRGLVGSMGADSTATRILYGGSVKPDNVDTLMAQADIDGALVGGASLQAEDFARIVRFRG